MFILTIAISIIVLRVAVRALLSALFTCFIDVFYVHFLMNE